MVYLFKFYYFDDILTNKFSDEFFRVIIFVICLCYFLISFSLEKLFVPFLSNWWNRKKIKELEEKANDKQINLNLGDLQKYKSVVHYSNKN